MLIYGLWAAQIGHSNLFIEKNSSCERDYVIFAKIFCKKFCV